MVRLPSFLFAWDKVRSEECSVSIQWPMEAAAALRDTNFSSLRSVPCQRMYFKCRVVHSLLHCLAMYNCQAS